MIGAGVTGLTTAYELLDRGFEVTVFDRNRYAAMETSFANGGQLSASNAETWTQWGTVLKGLKWMLQADAPLLVNPAPTLHKIRWMAEFLSNIPNYKKNTVETVRLAIAARAVLFEMAEREGIDFDLERRGILHFYSPQKDLAHARMVNGLLAEGGLVRRELSPAEIREVEPALHGDFVGGFLTESDSSGDIHKFTVGLAAACARRGADLRFGTDVYDVAAVDGGVRISSSGGEESFDGVVVSAGVRSRAIAAALGDRVNIYPVKGYSITVAARRRREPGGGALDQPARRQVEDRRQPLRQGPLPHRRHRRVHRRQPRHPRRPHPAAGRVVREALPRHLDRARDALGGAPADDAVDAAAGRPRQEARGLLQHRPRPPRLDAVRRDRPDRRRERRRRARAARAPPPAPVAA